MGLEGGGGYVNLSLWKMCSCNTCMVPYVMPQLSQKTQLMIKNRPRPTAMRNIAEN